MVELWRISLSSKKSYQFALIDIAEFIFHATIIPMQLKLIKGIKLEQKLKVNNILYS